jgi:ATP-dependent RNA helicase DeaD
MANTYDIDIEKAELPEDPHRTATELLEKRYDDVKADLDDIDEFVPLVQELSEERPELLASLVTELYAQSKDEENGEADAD